MVTAHLAPPTFESSRENNEFVSRLLLHHFLDAKDLEWLRQFEKFDLSNSQKQVLIFVREVGAINNPTYRQMADCDIIKASADLRELRRYEFLISKGKGKATYYVSGKKLSTQPLEISTQPQLEIPQELLEEVSKLKQREHDEQKVMGIIERLCSIRALTSDEIAGILNKREDHIRRKYLSKMI